MGRERHCSRRPVGDAVRSVPRAFCLANAARKRAAWLETGLLWAISLPIGQTATIQQSVAERIGIAPNDGADGPCQ